MLVRLLLSTAAPLMLLAGCGSAPAAADASPDLFDKRGPELRRFASAAEFQSFLAETRKRSQAAQAEAMNEHSPSLMKDMAPAAEPPGIEAGAAAQATVPTNPEITNNQTAGVDEGGIVKQIGDHLVVLQDGRLFSVALGREAGGELRLADRIDVYRSPQAAADWYDEMLVFGDRILVTAYSYRDSATEITVLRLARDGRLERQGRFLISSNDYYSTENYATRLVGDKLILYAPAALDPYGTGFAWPRLRRADGDAEPDKGEPLLAPTDIYAPAGTVEWPVLHTLSVCPLANGMECRTTGVIGPAMREFYVSPTDAFLWIGAPEGLPWSIDYANQRRRNCPGGGWWNDGADQPALVYRLPLDGGAAGAVAVDGLPVDQFALDSRSGRFRALLMKSEPRCEGATEGPRDLALLDIPLGAFGERLGHVARKTYVPLPAVAEGELENRFVGDWLIYGGRSSWSGLPEGKSGPARSTLVTVPLSRPRQPVSVELPHNALRIERAGNGAVVTGYRDRLGLRMSYVALGERPRVGASTLLPERFEAEGRSHAFGAALSGDGTGLVAVPTTRGAQRSGRGWSDSESSELSFVALERGTAMRPAGELPPGGTRAAPGYSCAVSCVDWYGNSRPIFTGGRIFALMGTELVEGRLDGGRMRALGRVDLTASPARLARR
jgi:hypothetical protein